MFKFLKRQPAPQPRPVSVRKAFHKATFAEARLEAPVVPEVTEGNDQTDWALWEDSVAAIDSQLQPLTPAARTSSNRGAPSVYDEMDAFARVTRKDA